jgi:hypothetical protein
MVDVFTHERYVMTNINEASISSHLSDNHILYSLIKFLHYFKDPYLGHIDIDAPIGTLDEVTFLTAVSLFETHHDFIVPDLTLADKNKSLRQIANEFKSGKKVLITRSTPNIPGLRLIDRN